MKVVFAPSAVDGEDVVTRVVAVAPARPVRRPVRPALDRLVVFLGTVATQTSVAARPVPTVGPTSGPVVQGPGVGAHATVARAPRDETTAVVVGTPPPALVPAPAPGVAAVATVTDARLGETGAPASLGAPGLPVPTVLAVVVPPTASPTDRRLRPAGGLASVRAGVETETAPPTARRPARRALPGRLEVRARDADVAPAPTRLPPVTLVGDTGRPPAGAAAPPSGDVRVDAVLASPVTADEGAPLLPKGPALPVAPVAGPVGLVTVDAGRPGVEEGLAAVFPHGTDLVGVPVVPWSPAAILGVAKTRAEVGAVAVADTAGPSVVEANTATIPVPGRRVAPVPHAALPAATLAQGQIADYILFSQRARRAPSVKTGPLSCRYTNSLNTRVTGYFS